jgi:hypothetical protein
VLVLTGLVACSEMPFPGIDTPLPECECPLLIEEVESIDWVPGVLGRQTDATGAERDHGPSVTYEFEVDDATAEPNRLDQLLAAGGFKIERATTQAFYARDTHLTITVSELEGRLRVTITLMDGATDEEAPRILEPVKQAVGER